MAKVLVVDSLIHELPFSDAMNWETFQLFCTDLLFSRLGITTAREYLAQGSEQDGIDVYATEGISGKLITAQCKLEKYLGPKDVDDIIELFLKGQFAVSGSEFILCTNFDLSRHRDEEATLTSARDKLGALGIVFTVWDKKGLSTELRNNPAPELLCRYFDMTIARAFYGPVYEAWIKDYRKISKLPYQENKDHIDRKLTTRTDYYQSVNDPYYLYWNDRFVKLVDLIDAARQPGKGKFLVLSIAGFGKTFEMDHIAAHYAGDQEYLYPVKMYLRDYEGQSVPALLDMFCARWKDLNQQSLLLVLDGLDEMKEVHYQTFINHLNLFCDTAEAVRVVVSTRFNFYDMANPPLRNFEILVLHPFSQQDIDEYISGRLATRKTKFLAAVKKYGFEEYLENPYYLARLVRFYDEAPAAFPVSRPELFDRILFELFDKDNSLNADALTRSEFLRVSQKIAYCMTVAGKPFLTSAQMEQLLISAGKLKVIKKYFLLNKNAMSLDDWSFEHKNLQEYLCASFLQLLPLERLLEIATYPYDRQKIQTKFINTFAFLFALVDQKSEQFKALLAWLTTNQQELLIRFEKERIPRPVRLEIGKSILRYYCAENLSLFAASGFSLQELADFMEIDAQVISYIDQRIAEDTGDWYAYFGIDLIGRSTKAYLIKESLTALLLKVLGNAAFSTRVHANAIDALTRLGLFDQGLFEKILSSPIDLAASEVRNMLVLYLNSADFTEDYLDLLIETIPVFEQMENNFRQLGSSELLKKIILRSARPASKKKILQYVLSDTSTLSLEEAGDSKLTAEEFKELMSAALELYKADPALFDLVYAFYLDNQAITLYGEWLAPVLDFFRATVGLPHVFHLVYNTPNRIGRHFVELADRAECDFLLAEYETGKIKKDEMVIVRNILGNTNHPQFNYFYAELNRRTDNDFIVADIDFNYQEHWKSYRLKNQQMLEDRSLFLKEVEEIFTVLELETVVKKDFHNYQDYKLHKYQQSIALGKLRLDADKIPRSKADMISALSDDDNWKYYKISEISRLLSRRKQEPDLVLQPSLLNDAEAWIKAKIWELDYLHSITDNSQGTATFDRQVEFNNDLYLKLEPDLDDALLLQMIPSDYRGGIQHRDLGLSGVIISKVKDQAALKSAVLAYLKMDLAMYVQKTLFAICEKLDYTECLEPLYQFITTDARLAGSDRNFLTDLYTGLGGDVTDFSAFVSPVPQKEELDYLSWNWYLIEKLLDAEPETMAALLRPVLTDALQPESHQVLASEYLIRLNDYQGLVYWSDFIVTHGKTPFENRHDFVKAKIHLIDHPDLIPLLFRTMEPFIVADAQMAERPRNLISEFIADLLLLLVSRSPALFAQIDPMMEALITKYPEPKPVYWLKRYRREITQEYHNQSMPELSIEEIARDFENAINASTIKQN